MLSDELTTGSITTSVSDKQILASRSHAWNIKNKKFRDAFPDVSTYHESQFAELVKHCWLGIASLFIFPTVQSRACKLTLFALM